MNATEFQSGNIFIRPAMLFVEEGTVVEGHVHNFDHTTIFFTGRFRVEAILHTGEKLCRDFAAPDHCLIRADVQHKITALEDNSTMWCVYAHRDPQGEVCENYTGWPPAYSNAKRIPREKLFNVNLTDAMRNAGKAAMITGNPELVLHAMLRESQDIVIG